MPQNITRRGILGVIGSAMGGTYSAAASGTTPQGHTLNFADNSDQNRPYFPKTTLTLELLQNFPRELLQLRPATAHGANPPQGVAEFNIQSYISNIQYFPPERPPLRYGPPEIPRFSLIEFATKQEARAAFKKVYQAQAGETPEQIGDQGKWLFRRLQTSDGTLSTLLSASQQVDNIIVDGVVDMEAYKNPRESLRTQIKQGNGSQYGREAFHPFLRKVASYYRENKPYSRLTFQPTKYARLQTSLGDFDISTAQRIVENELGILTERGDESNELRCPSDVCRGYQFFIPEKRMSWYAPLDSAEWFKSGTADSTRVGIWSFSDNKRLVELVTQRFTHWGFRPLRDGEGTLLSLQNAKNTQEFIGVRGGLANRADYPIVVNGEAVKYIVSGNVVMSLAGANLPS